MGMRQRLSWMISGPARLADLDRRLASVEHQLDSLYRQQEAVLAELRQSVSDVVDDVTTRLGELAASTDDER